MKLKTIIDSKDAIIRLSKNSLPINIAWELKKLIKQIDPHLTSYEEIRQQKIIEMGEKSGEGSSAITTVKSEMMDEFMSQINELISKEIEITLPNIKMKELLEYKDSNGAAIGISTGDLIAMDWLLSE